jgi:hypothetical protein
MHYVTHRSHLMQKHKFSVTCPSALFVESVLDPHEHEKLCIKDLRHERNKMHYMTHKSHQMPKHKFGVTCLTALFVESVLDPPKHEK